MDLDALDTILYGFFIGGLSSLMTPRLNTTAGPESPPTFNYARDTLRPFSLFDFGAVRPAADTASTAGWTAPAGAGEAGGGQTWTPSRVSNVLTAAPPDR